MKNVLVTGGCGYIGSHTAISLLLEKHNVIILDNLCNSSFRTITKINKISKKKCKFYKGDITDEKIINEILHNENIDAIFHFAGLKSIEESIVNPRLYYSTSINGILTLLKYCKKYGVNRFIYSSSATVYGSNFQPPFSENLSLEMPFHSYGASKLIVEKILKDYSSQNHDFRCAVFRYFNPVGVHNSYEIGENLNKNNTNLIPNIIRVLKGELKKLVVYGDDFNTPDGTGIRDYIHIDDLVSGHISILKKMKYKKKFNVWNLGTGTGHSVLEVIEAFENIAEMKIPYIVKMRRPGDLDSSWADIKKVNKEINWFSKKNLHDMASDVCDYYLNK